MKPGSVIIANKTVFLCVKKNNWRVVKASGLGAAYTDEDIREMDGTHVFDVALNQLEDRDLSELISEARSAVKGTAPIEAPKEAPKASARKEEPEAPLAPIAAPPQPRPPKGREVSLEDGQELLLRYGGDERANFPLVEEGFYRIPESNWEEIKKKLDRLVRKATKLGLPAPEIKVVREEYAPVFVQGPGWFYYTGGIWKSIVLEVHDTIVRLPNWEFCATIDHYGADGKLQAGNLIRTAPGYHGAIPTAYRSGKPTCDHCNTVRPRNHTYVVKGPEGFRRIGRSCLADYIGDANAERILTAGDIQREIQEMFYGEDEEGYRRGESTVGAGIFLALVSALIRLRGWIKRSGDREEGVMPTADEAWYRVFSKKPLPRIMEEVDFDNAKKAIAWAKAIPENSSDYLHNIRVIAHEPYWGARLIGYGASIMTAWQRTLEQKVESTSFLGEVGDKIGGKDKKRKHPPLPARILSVKPYNSDFGVTTYIRMAVTAPQGTCNCLWKASGSFDVRVGERYMLSGSIKELKQDKGSPETVLTRCTLEKV